MIPAAMQHKNMGPIHFERRRDYRQRKATSHRSIACVDLLTPRERICATNRLTSYAYAVLSERRLRSVECPKSDSFRACHTVQSETR